MTAETIAEEMAENVTDEVAETEIITVKMVETKKAKSVENFGGFSGGGTHPPKKIKNMVLNGFKWLEMPLNTTKVVRTIHITYSFYEKE